MPRLPNRTRCTVVAVIGPHSRPLIVQQSLQMTMENGWLAVYVWETRLSSTRTRCKIQNDVLWTSADGNIHRTRLMYMYMQHRKLTGSNWEDVCLRTKMWKWTFGQGKVNVNVKNIHRQVMMVVVMTLDQSTHEIHETRSRLTDVIANRKQMVTATPTKTPSSSRAHAISARFGLQNSYRKHLWTMCCISVFFLVHIWTIHGTTAQL